jgi:hypothetical protein
MDKTVVIQIGNSDDKLTQSEWAVFHYLVNNTIEDYAQEIHFVGHAAGNSPFQNACFVAVVESDYKLKELKEELKRIRAKYKQDSVAWMEGTTEFV